MKQDPKSSFLRLESRYVHKSTHSMMAPSAVATDLHDDETPDLIQITDEDMQFFSNKSMENLIFETLENRDDDFADSTTISKEQNEVEGMEVKPSMMQLLQNFDPQVPPPPDASMEDMQLWLECSSQQESVLKYEAMLESAREREDYTSMSTVQRQLLQWYQPMRERIISEQEAYFKRDKNKGANKYGPFLCTLQPEKLAIITTHEASMYALKMGGKGATLMKMALMIGNAVEAEVNVQRLLRQRMENKQDYGVKKESAEQAFEEAEEAKVDEFLEEKKEKKLDWVYGPSHLQRFVDEMHRSDPSRKGKVRIARANRRAMQLLESAEPWATGEKVILGAVLIQMLLEEAKVSFQGKDNKPAFVYEKNWVSHNKLVGHISMNDDLYNMIVEDKFSCLDSYTTRHKPMIIPPKEWTGLHEGGYSLLQTEFMRAHGCQVQKVSKWMKHYVRCCTKFKMLIVVDGV